MKKTIIVATERRFSLNNKSFVVDKDNTRSAEFWKRYLSCFDRVIVVCRVDRTDILDSDNSVEAPGIETFEVPYYHGLFQAILRYYSVRKRLKSLIESHISDYYLLRVPGRLGSLIANILNERGKLNYSVEVVGDPFDVYNSQKGILNKIMARRFRVNLKKLVARAYSATYVTSKYLQRVYPFKDGFQNYYSDIKLTQPFLNGEKSFLERRLLLVGIGNLDSPYKGVGLLLTSLKELNSQGIDFHLSWIGNGKLLSKYIDFLKKNDLEKHVSFLGSVPNFEIPFIFSENNIFIMPSLQEGLPRAMVEAMASGLICLGSDVGGIPELISDDCIFKSNDPKAIGKKLLEVYNNFNYFTKYSSINYRRALEFLPEKLELKHLEFLKSLKDNRL